MFSIYASQLASAYTARVAAPRARNARHCRRAAVTVRATATESPNPKDSYGFEAPSCELNDQADAISRGAAIDPSDGSIAEAAPLGNDNSLFTNALVAFKEPRAVEIINGRAAMIGWMVALSAEVTNEQSLARQVLNTRSFTLADGIEKTSTFPAAGMFLVPVTVLAVLAASLAPALRGSAENGLDQVPKDFSVFKASSEMTNGRAAMVGLVSLALVEKFTNGALF